MFTLILNDKNVYLCLLYVSGLSACAIHDLFLLVVDTKVPLDFLQNPVKIVLGIKRKPSGFGPKRRLVEKEESFVYIPILETLEALLSNETVLSEVTYTLMYCNAIRFC